LQAARLWHPHIEHGQGHRTAAGVREKTSASSKLSAFSPSESSSCLIEFRTEASSSRMHMDSGSGDIGSAPDTNPKCQSKCTILRGPTPMVPWGHAARALRPPAAQWRPNASERTNRGTRATRSLRVHGAGDCLAVAGRPPDRLGVCLAPIAPNGT
jgi:hypothetical protein